MARYIDADALMEHVKAIHKAVDTSGINQSFDTGFHSATSQMQGLIAWMQTIDAVPVVHCKDCEYWTKQVDSLQGRCALGGHYPTGNWYCANGERRNDAVD